MKKTLLNCLAVALMVMTLVAVIYLVFAAKFNATVAMRFVSTSRYFWLGIYGVAIQPCIHDVIYKIESQIFE